MTPNDMMAEIRDANLSYLMLAQQMNDHRCRNRRDADKKPALPPSRSGQKAERRATIEHVHDVQHGQPLVRCAEVDLIYDDHLRDHVCRQHEGGQQETQAHAALTRHANDRWVWPDGPASADR